MHLQSNVQKQLREKMKLTFEVMYNRVSFFSLIEIQLSILHTRENSGEISLISSIDIS